MLKSESGFLNECRMVGGRVGGGDEQTFQLGTRDEGTMLEPSVQ